MKNILFFYLLCLSPALLAQGQRYYVHAAAAGANTGQSWTDAFTDLQTALQAAQAGDEVWVAEGLYKPTAGTDRGISFEPRSGVRLFGGFAGTETALDQRDWEKYPAVLRGDIGAAGDSSDNSNNVLYLHQPDSSTVVDGFTLRDAVADGGLGGSAFGRIKCGGGLYIMGQDWEAYPTVRNCLMAHNTARNYGGGAFVNGSGDGSVAPQFVNCRFEDNRSLGSGGGLAWLGASWVERPDDILNCSFLRNTAVNYGGGLYTVDAERADHLDISGCRILESQAG